MEDGLIGRIVAERFEVVSELGEGGMGRVVEAKNLVTGRMVALKIPLAKVAADAGLRKRFLREARACSALCHPHVVDVLDVVVDGDGTPVMVMELLTGTTLASLLKPWSGEPEPLTVPETASYLVPVLEALHQAHAIGLVHRDFKPANVFLAEQPGGVVPKLLDFGIAKMIEGAPDATATTTGAMLGTPLYMAPEQVSGQREIDQRVDVWAAGAVTYECLTGRRPFAGENFGQIFAAVLEATPEPLGPEVPAELAAAVMAALTRDRAARSADLVELLVALRPFVSDDLGPPPALVVRPVEPGDESDAFAPTIQGPTDPGTLEPGTLAGALERPPEKRAGTTWMALAGVAAIVATSLIAWRGLSSDPEPAPAAAPARAARGVASPEPPAASPAAPAPPPPRAAVVASSVTPVVAPPPRAVAAPKAKPSASAAPRIVPGGVVDKPDY